MCRAFAFLMTRAGNCYWRAGVDSHDALLSEFRSQDAQLRDLSEVEKGPYCAGEYVPAGSPYPDYLADEGWHFAWRPEDGDGEVKPEWWGYNHERVALRAWREWHDAVYSKIKDEARNPINPLALEPPEITPEVLSLLAAWVSARSSARSSAWNSVWDSVWSSMGNSVGGSVWDSVWHAVRDSVRDSVWDSVGAYFGSLFSIWHDGYPYEAGARLWRMGLVPMFDGDRWHLCGGKDARVLWSGTAEEARAAAQEVSK